MSGEHSAEAVWGWQGQLETIAERSQHILGKEILSDVVFRIGALEGPTADVKAHRLLLALADPFFERMFYGPQAVTTSMVRVMDIDLETFISFLRYIYHDETSRLGTAAIFAKLHIAKYSIGSADNQEDISIRLRSIKLLEEEGLVGLNKWQRDFKTIAERAQYALEKEILCDVTFRVGHPSECPVEIKAHKFLLAMGSAVFESMFYGPMADADGIIDVDDIDHESFRFLLQFLYHDERKFGMDNAFTIFNGAKKYGMLQLKCACERFMRTEVTAEYCLAWFVQAKMFSETDLANFFLEKIDDWGPSVLLSEDFLELDIDTVKEILVRDSLGIKEMDLCIAAMRWAVNRCRQKDMVKSGQNLRSELGDALFLIRFPLLTAFNVCSIMKHDLLLSEEVDSLYRYWFNKDETNLPPKFITRKRLTRSEVMKRQMATEVTISRFGSANRQARSYMTDSSDAIKFSVRALTRCSTKGEHFQTPEAQVAMSLVAIGVFLDFLSGTNPERGISFHLYECGESGTKPTELQEYRQSFKIVKTETGLQIRRFQLKRSVPITMKKDYIILIRNTGICQSVRNGAPSGVCTVTGSAGDFRLTVQFANLLLDKGQIPELHFLIA